MTRAQALRKAMAEAVAGQTVRPDVTRIVQKLAGVPVTIEAGQSFDTQYERGCTATTVSDDDGNFRGLDSDGVECEFTTRMITRIHGKE